MSIRHFIVPLMVDGEHQRAALVMDDTDKHGTITINGQNVCDFEVETAGSVGNYFIAERLVRSHVEQLLDVAALPVDTGFSPVT